ncbi:hypothetical protein BK649_06150 [Pseudomonas canadensis]|uniref:Uncharacterized protein n=1 Tax=Pseudomonas canadensis TaxID=915099 RepID=A0A423FG25_9PSED|nr:hypothetical protein BK649_06150 [Pseudomonas canadensis]
MKLLSPITQKEIIIRKCLKTSSLTDGQASTLIGIVMNKIMTILRYMTSDRRRRLLFNLHPKSVAKLTTLPIFMIGSQSCQMEFFMTFRRYFVCIRKNGRINITS